MLLAVDLGLKAGFALYGDDGRLLNYHSKNFGSPARLKRAAHAILRETPGLTALVLEGGGPICDLWLREGEKRGLDVLVVTAETWREPFLYQRERTSGAQAKRFAGDMARRVIAWSGLKKPTSLRHDAAEAIMTGLWGVLETGLLPALPDELKR